MKNVILCLALSSVALVAFESSAQAVPCTNDVDCPEPACGGQVCQWAGITHSCVAAGTDPTGTDGWCTLDSDCKCAGLGAKCVGVHCSFTKPPVDGGTSDATGTDATDGASDAPATDSGTKTDAAPPADTGTSTADTGGFATDTGAAATDTGTAAAAPASDSGGCAMGAPLATQAPWAVGLAAIALAAARRRRQR